MQKIQEKVVLQLGRNGLSHVCLSGMGPRHRNGGLNHKVESFPWKTNSWQQNVTRDVTHLNQKLFQLRKESVDQTLLETI